MTHRQFVAWQYHLVDDYDRPSRSDYYTMALRADVRSLTAKKPVKVNDCRLRFGKQDDAPRMSVEQAAAIAKSAWAARMGRPVQSS